jgi:hypothetical protein
MTKQEFEKIKKIEGNYRSLNNNYFKFEIKRLSEFKS